MSEAGPVWLQVVTGFAAPITAAFVAWIAFQQWRTASTKLSLDLYEKRYAIYQKTADALWTVNRDGGCKMNDSFNMLVTARGEARFLFGPEVERYIDRLLDVVVVVQGAEEMMEAPDDQHEHHVKEKWDGVKSLASERAKLIDVFGPYLRMQAKPVRTLADWFHHRNAIRKSFSDQP